MFLMIVFYEFFKALSFPGLALGSFLLAYLLIFTDVFDFPLDKQRQKELEQSFKDHPSNYQSVNQKASNAFDLMTQSRKARRAGAINLADKLEAEAKEIWRKDSE